jgi:uncharacterized protein (DUF302 family)
VYFRVLSDEASGAASCPLADLDAGETPLFGGHARRARTVSSVLGQRRWHPWFGGTRRDEFLERVRALPHAPLHNLRRLPMTTPYAFTIELAQPLTAALEALRAALMAEQMGIVSEVDVQATLKTKLGIDSHPQRLLGICSPGIAHTLLTAEPDLAAMLPCGGGASEAVPGRTRIVLQDPRVIAAVSDSGAVRAACELAHAALRRVMDRLADGAGGRAAGAA